MRKEELWIWIIPKICLLGCVNVPLLMVSTCVSFLSIISVILPSDCLPQNLPPNLTEEPLKVHEDPRLIVEGWCPHVSRNISHYVLPHNSTTILQPTWSCGKHSPYLLVIVCSALDHVEARAAIRDTWGSVRKVKKSTVHLAFLIGVPHPNSRGDEHEKTLDEYYRFGDIIQEPFIDTYNNLTLKTVFLLKWVRARCTGARFILKSDDDVFVNIRSLVLLLRRLGRRRALASYKKSLAFSTTTKIIKTYSPLLLGKLVKDAFPDKTPGSKYYVPSYMYPNMRYPVFLLGNGYVMSASAIAPLYNQSLRTPLFHLEDVFITGICAAQAGIVPRNHSAFTNKRRELDPCQLMDRSVVTSHFMGASTLREIWSNMQLPNLTCSLNVSQKRTDNGKKYELNQEYKIKGLLQNHAGASNMIGYEYSNSRLFSRKMNISNIKSGNYGTKWTFLPSLFYVTYVCIVTWKFVFLILFHATLQRTLCF